MSVDSPRAEWKTIFETILHFVCNISSNLRDISLCLAWNWHLCYYMLRFYVKTSATYMDSSIEYGRLPRAMFSGITNLDLFLVTPFLLNHFFVFFLLMLLTHLICFPLHLIEVRIHTKKNTDKFHSGVRSYWPFNDWMALGRQGI